MYNSTMRTFTGRMFIATLGCIIMSIGINVFTTPWNFYTTGLVGYSQFLRSVLVEDYGIAESRLSPSGAGETKPVTPNTNDAARAKNRRVELVKL